MGQVCVFDLTGTLLDLSALDRSFEKIFGVRELRRVWVQTIYHNALVLSLIGRYEGLREIAAHTLSSLALAERVTPDAEEVYTILKTLETLPAFPDVEEGLAAFRSHGYRLVALTNSSLHCAESQLAHLQLRPYFEKVFSTDAVQVFKPDRRPYELVAAELNVEPRDLWMVTGHAWDAAGANQAGYSTALVIRKENGYHAGFPEPDVMATTLSEVANGIGAHERFPYGKVAHGATAEGGGARAYA